MQLPEAEQLSALTAQFTQACPLPPHVVVARFVQVDPRQQPVVQLAAQPLQTPLVQVSLSEAQAWQAPPPTPH